MAMKSPKDTIAAIYKAKELCSTLKSKDAVRGVRDVLAVQLGLNDERGAHTDAADQLLSILLAGVDSDDDDEDIREHLRVKKHLPLLETRSNTLPSNYFPNPSLSGCWARTEGKVEPQPIPSNAVPPETTHLKEYDSINTEFSVGKIYNFTRLLGGTKDNKYLMLTDIVVKNGEKPKLYFTNVSPGKYSVVEYTAKEIDRLDGGYSIIGPVIYEAPWWKAHYYNVLRPVPREARNLRFGENVIFHEMKDGQVEAVRVRIKAMLRNVFEDKVEIFYNHCDYKGTPELETRKTIVWADSVFVVVS